MVPKDKNWIISFPGLPDLLLSSTGLVSLELRRVPHSWYISPDAMVTHLSALTRLESLILGFKFRRSRPDRESRRSPPPIRTIIPALTRFKFEGATEYAEDLVTRIDTLRLDNLDITFFPETVLDISNLSQFISRRVPKFQTPDEARVTFSYDYITAKLFFPAAGHERFVLGILGDESARRLSSFIHLCRPFLPAFARVERLYIYQYGNRRQRWEDMFHWQAWQDFPLLLYFFTHAKDLYVSSEVTTYIVPFLKHLVGERTTEVLPALQNLFLHKGLSGHTDIEDFIAARELSGQPIVVSRWISH